MFNRQWTRRFGMAAVVALAACGGDANEAELPADDVDVPAVAPAPAPAVVGANVQFPEGVTAEMASAGQQLFNGGVCMACHGPNGAGTPLAPALTDQNWLNTDGSFEGIVSVIQNGVQEPKEHPGVMPPLGGGQYNEQQVRELAAYVYALANGG